MLLNKSNSAISNNFLIKVQSSIKSSGFSAKICSDHEDIDNFLRKIKTYCPVAYTPSYIDYNIEYRKEKDKTILNLPLLVLQDDRVIGFWPLTATAEAQGIIEIGSAGGALLPPLFAHDLSVRTQKKYIKECYSFLKILCKEVSVYEIICEDIFLNKQSLSPWFSLLLKDAHSIENKFKMFLKIHPPLEDIRKNFRRTYLPLITKAKGLWKPQLHTSVTTNDWNEFRNLHIHVSGRQTRSSSTWSLQLQAINKGSAFYISLKNAKNTLIGGALFNISKNEMQYSVGVFLRHYFDQPVSHLVQSLAVEEALSRGISWYNLGECLTNNNKRYLDKKSHDIDFFKEGFSSDLMISPRIYVNLKEDI